MLPPRHTLYIEPGDVYEITILWKDSEDEPIDLTGRTVKWFFSVDTPGLTITTSNGLTVIDDDGSIALHLTPTQTNFTEHRGSHRLVIDDGLPTERTLIKGTVISDAR